MNGFNLLDGDVTFRPCTSAIELQIKGITPCIRMKRESVRLS